MKITARVVGAERVLVNLSRLSAQAVAQVRATVRRLGFELERRVKTGKITGQVLHRRTGRLARSINTRFESTPQKETARVGTNVVYGRAWELGFRVPARTIVPREKKALFWAGAAHPVRSVRQKARTVAARPFLRPALDEMRGEIRAEILAAAQGAVRRGGA